MRTPLLVALSAALFLTACGTVRESRFNPFNWFGRSTQETVSVPVETTEVQDPRPLVEQVVSMRVEKIPEGAIVHAVGLTKRQGYWQAALLAENDGQPNEKGQIVLQFRAAPPVTTSAVGPAPSRELTAALFFSTQDLASVRSIIVVSRTNQRTSRR